MPRRCLALLCLLAIAGCARDPAPRLPASAVSVSTAEAGAAAALISRYRQAKGLGPVAADARLNAAAERQARAVAQAGELSHGDFKTRMGEFGIAGHAAENLTAGSATVDQAVERWKASPGHDANLLMPQARRIGLARADSPGHGYERYWALVLGQ